MGSNMEVIVRGLALLGCVASLLSGCGGGDKVAENSESAPQNLTSETPPAGDTTAIDAATGADANMAAAAEIPANEADSNAATNTTDNSD
jgi:hypothetical protein